MGKKAVFFDADGTVCDVVKGVPQSARDAIQELRANGHRAILCTGRSRAFITKDLEDLGFDGMVAACGAYLEYGKQQLSSLEQTSKTAWESVQILREHGLVPVLEGPEYLYYDTDEYTNEVDWFAEIITRQIGNRRQPIRGNEKKMRINKITAKVRPGSDPDGACEALSVWYDAIRHYEGMVEGMIELIPKGVTKATGIRALCESLHVEWKDTIAFGDSNNDLPMFEYVAVKVAMGNAPLAVRNLADHVTDDMFHHGIRNGLVALGLING